MKKYKRAIEYIYGNISSKLFGKHIIYVTNNDYWKYAEKNIKQMKAYDLIIGISRSGLPFAMMISNVNKIPFCLSTNLDIWYKRGNPEDILDAIKFGYNDRYIENLIKNKCERVPNNITRSILVVDDSIDTGRTINNVISKDIQSKATTAVIICTDYLTNFYSIKLPPNRIFEWELSNYYLFETLSDLDGVICENYDNISDYDLWIKTTKQKLMPSFPITIFTARKEKYRKQTEEWLAEHNVQYKNLFMESDVYKKIQIVKKLKPKIIWESEYGIAKRLWLATRIPVICFDKNCIICR